VENPIVSNEPVGSATRHGAITMVITWFLMQIADHNAFAVPVEVVAAGAGAVAAMFGGIWRKFIGA
jgi:hypothetical protein